MIKCSFCGYEFTEEESKKSCASCPLNKNCGKYKCPNCGYEILGKSRLFSFLKKKKGRK
ncbi:MAG: hypothetical protein KZY61_09720 [Clostridiaceae bacterium]|uniref:hypothetical protein n=1 Tax=Anaerosalibacter bizertensis TaxID=932217 RepID=UPI001769A5A2|nr:hypothetical protein [Anaerosalibacter bizertensis]MBU5292869.1 hypothetical protein [Anaerosalibacter bizertensis]MBW4868911.1 hypothetical protein [Clostridiaceae bacterium]HHV25801.1 hypothetical protein [Tissierellia bacterium]